MKRKILIIGACGTIGKILVNGLKEEFEVILSDIKDCKTSEFEVKYLNASNLQSVRSAIDYKTDTIINLIALPEMPEIVTSEEMDQMIAVYLKGSFNILEIAKEKQVKRVIFASSNHVTDAFEENGNSLIVREIDTETYPLSNGVYGTLKLAAENLGYIYYKHYGLSVINLRIGTVKEEEAVAVASNGRTRKTILSKLDTIELFRKAIESEIKYGTYYAVSNNPGKPWSLKKTIEELDYEPKRNSTDILKER